MDRGRKLVYSVNPGKIEETPSDSKDDVAHDGGEDYRKAGRGSVIGHGPR